MWGFFLFELIKVVYVCINVNVLDCCCVFYFENGGGVFYRGRYELDFFIVRVNFFYKF